ncbi:GDP-mannose 4,6-dehydratase [Patescibacteria group bacterium]|nr:GDP-mannose 4,6-dehydratase [Patescibacteria group bacterium]
MYKQVIFDRKNVLVVGGAGFIGSHLCDELVKTSKVICIDNFITGSERNIDHLLANPNFVFILHDINESINLTKISSLQKFKIEFQGIQEVYNLACPTSPYDFEKNIEATLMANSIGMKNVLDITLGYGSKLVHFSSSVVYGPRRNDNIKIKEDDIGQVNHLSNRSSYDEGKRFAETMIVNYMHTHKIDAKIIRVFRTYGPRMKLNDGQLVPDFVVNALDNKDLVVTGDKDFCTSVCYVSDVISASIQLMETEVNGPVNVGSDVDLNLTTLAQKIIDLTGSKSKVIYSSSILFFSPLALPDITKATQELGWIPVVTLENGLKQTVHDLMATKGLRNINDSV